MYRSNPMFNFGAFVFSLNHFPSCRKNLVIDLLLGLRILDDGSRIFIEIVARLLINYLLLLLVLFLF